MSEKITNHSPISENVSSIQDTDLSFKYLLIAYKRNKNQLNNSQFWTSEKPFLHLSQILKSELKVTFLERYFSKDNNCNHDLNFKLLEFAKNDCIKHFKLWRAYKHHKFRDSFKTMAKSDEDINKLIKDLDVIIKAEELISKQEKDDNIILLKYSFGEIAMAFTLYYYAFKQDSAIRNNKNLQTQIETTLFREFKSLIKSYIKEKRNLDLFYNSNMDCQEEFNLYKAPHHILGKDKITPSREKNNIIFEYINRAIVRDEQKSIIELYLSGFGDFGEFDKTKAILHTNNTFKIYNKNNKKHHYEDMFFFDYEKSIKDIYNSIIQTELIISSNLSNLSFYGISTKISTNEKEEINIKKLMTLLVYFSRFKGPEQSFISLQNTRIVTNKADNHFIELFGNNESISIFEHTELKNNISKYFNWSKDEVSSILKFLTLDMNSYEKTEDYYGRPFLKINNKILWMGSFLKDRNWVNVISNKLKKEKELNKDINLLSNNLEKSIENSFNEKGFKTIYGEKYKSSDGAQGDFDVLAYKDKTLFVCEVKMGQKTDDFQHYAYTETTRLEGCAVEQLKKATKYINENWNEIKKKLYINDKTTINDIQIVPLIVTDYFEGDLKIFDGIRKISFLELYVILNNKKKKLLKYQSIYSAISNRNNPSLKNINFKKIKWDFWDSKKKNQTDNIRTAIDNDLIWRELDKIWKFDEVELKLYF